MLMTWPGLVTRRPRRSFDSADGFASRLRNARRLSAASRQLANASRERVQRCRALIGRKRMICGGSDDVRGIIRARVQAGELTELRGLAGARPARGQRCAGCDDAITAPDLEFELFGPRPVWMHPACYAIWLDETTSDAAMDSPGSPRKWRSDRHRRPGRARVRYGGPRGRHPGFRATGLRAMAAPARLQRPRDPGAWGHPAKAGQGEAGRSHGSPA